MALIQCPECHGTISNKATQCPHCGYPMAGAPPVAQSPETCLFKYKGKTFKVQKIVKAIKSGDLFDAKHYARTNVVARLKDGRPEDVDIIIDKICQQYNLTKPQSKEQHIPKCPTCGSTHIQKIDLSDRAVSLGLFGIASKTARSQFECKDCGYKW